MLGPIGWQEMIFIAVIILFVFGAKRLPEMGRSLGTGIKEFKKSLTTDLDEDAETNDEPKVESKETNSQNSQAQEEPQKQTEV